MSNRLSRRSLVKSAVALAAAAGVGWWLWGPRPGFLPGGPFTLHDGNGATVHDTDFLGRYLLVYFGYTALGKLSSVLDRLSKEELDRLAVVFISVDPQRDHGERLSDYGKAFHPIITGLTGSREQIDAVAKAYGARYEFAGDTTRDDYAIDHTSIIYVMGPDGRFLTKFTHNATPEAMLAKLQAVMK
jgi:protein SCO1/2